MISAAVSMFLITISIFQAARRLSWKEGLLSILPDEYFLPWIKQLTCDRERQYTNEACCPVRFLILDPRLMQVHHTTQGHGTVFFKVSFPPCVLQISCGSSFSDLMRFYASPSKAVILYTHAHTDTSAQRFLSWCAWCSHPMVLGNDFPGQQCLCKAHFVTAHFSVNAALV